MPVANITLYCSKAERKVPGWWVDGGGGVVVQTNFRVKPTTKLLWVAFELGCCCLAWLWGYDNSWNGRKHKKLELMVSTQKIGSKKYALGPDLFAKQWTKIPFLIKRPDLITFLPISQAPMHIIWRGEEPSQKFKEYKCWFVKKIYMNANLCCFK